MLSEKTSGNKDGVEGKQVGGGFEAETPVDAWREEGDGGGGISPDGGRVADQKAG